MAITISRRVRIGEGLSVLALILLLIYGADAALGSGKTAFLPMDEFSRGIIFGATSIALSITAFIISLKKVSNIISILLIINGILIIGGGIVADSYIVLGMGVIVLGMGVSKILRRV